MIEDANISIFKDLGLYFNNENKVQLPLPKNFFDSTPKRVESRECANPQIDFSNGTKKVYENFITSPM